jgi:hypothetical protein
MVCRWLKHLLSQVVPEIKTYVCLSDEEHHDEEHFMQSVLHFCKEHIDHLQTKLYGFLLVSGYLTSRPTAFSWQYYT